MPRTLFCVMPVAIIFTLNPTARSGKPNTTEIIRAEGETVFLPHPLPVLVVYFATEFFDGQMLFKNDIYKRDPALLEALDSPFKFNDES